MEKARIVSTGSYVPNKVLSNADLEKMVDTSDEWIFTRTGMKERRIADKNESASDMGVIAAKAALQSAFLSSSEVELVLVATMSPDYSSTPSTAALLQAKIGATRAAAVDVNAACSGFLYALSMAKAFIESGSYRNILLVAAEKMSAYTDYTDRSSCILFGDGAAACVISNSGSGYQIGKISLGADGDGGDMIILPAGGSRRPACEETLKNREHYIKMNGREVFKYAVRQMAQSSTQCLSDAKLKVDDVSWFVPHQANGRIIDAMAKSLNLPRDKVYLNLHKYGNTAASSIGIALDELVRENQIDEGENLLLAAFGAGLTWGAGLLTKVEDKNG